ncbi:MAG: DUF3019 domain-containing protein [Granulosicoccus sp.]
MLLHWKSQNLTSVQKLICLCRKCDPEALKCCKDKTEGMYRYSLEAAESTNFHLVAARQQQPVVARTPVKVNWVYNHRKTRRSRWKIF